MIGNITIFWSSFIEKQTNKEIDWNIYGQSKCIVFYLSKNNGKTKPIITNYSLLSLPYFRAASENQTINSVIVHFKSMEMLRKNLKEKEGNPTAPKEKTTGFCNNIFLKLLRNIHILYLASSELNRRLNMWGGYKSGKVVDWKALPNIGPFLAILPCVHYVLQLCQI